MNVYQIGADGTPCVLLLETEDCSVTLPKRLLSHYRFLIPELHGDLRDVEEVREVLRHAPGPVCALCATAPCWSIAEQAADSLPEGVFLAECSGRPGSMLIPELEQMIVEDGTEESA